MLTPVDVQNKVFKGGIGYDKKDVETFMKELSSDYEQLYRSSVEMKDKVATLTESLQHYRSTEESMQKALTLSEKTAEETIIAANDKARQIKNEATKKAEALLADARQELIETKDEIHRLQQLHAKFKAQYTKILQGQLQLIENKVVDIDLGEGYDIGDSSDYGFGGSSNLGGGLGGLGEGGGYTGASSFDDRFERTNQDPAFNRGSLNTDPFADAVNGGGRFSKHTGKGFTGNSLKQNASSSEENKTTLNVKRASAGSTKVKRSFTAASQNVTSQSATENKVAADPVKDSTTQEKPQAVAAKPESNATPASNVSQTNANTVFGTQQAVSEPSMDVVKSQVFTSEQPSPEPKPAKADLQTEAVISGDVEDKVDESTLIGNDDDDNEGFSFMETEASEQSYSEEAGIVSGEVEEKIDESTLISNDDDDDEGFNFMDEAVVSGEVEERVDESTMLESEDNYDEGFSFVSDEEDAYSDISVDDMSNSFEDDEDTAYAGEVEDKVNESTMLESEDNYDEGFDFVVGNDSDMEEEIPTISSGLNIDLDSFTNKSKQSILESEDDDILVGDVEEPVNQSNLIGNADDDTEGFNFL